MGLNLFRYIMYTTVFGIRDPQDPHLFYHLGPDPDPQKKTCGSRIQGYQIDQNRRKSFKEMFHIILSPRLSCVISHKLMNSTNFPL